MKKNLSLLCSIIAVSLLAAFAARADTTNIQTVPFHVQSASATGCPGTNFGYAYMTNSAGTMWFKPTNSTSGTLTDISGLAAPYVSTACVTRQMPVAKWCDTNAASFPIVSGNNYELYIFVKTSGLTNGQPMTLQVVWQ